MDTKHTSGPWSVIRDGQILRIKSDIVPGYFVEIRGACRQAFGYEGEANARLIAAAPGLLEALRDPADYAQIVADGGGTLGTLRRLSGESRAAIAKATRASR